MDGSRGPSWSHVVPARGTPIPKKLGITVCLPRCWIGPYRYRPPSSDLPACCSTWAGPREGANQEERSRCNSFASRSMSALKISISSLGPGPVGYNAAVPHDIVTHYESYSL